MKNFLNKTAWILAGLGIGAGFSMSLVVQAWTGPTGTAPNNNVGAPLNVSSTGQAKAGGLELNTGGATNGLIVHGKLGVGTVAPISTLQVTGTDSVYDPGNGQTGIFSITTGTGVNTDPKIEFGVHDAGSGGGYGWIQALNTSVGFRPLALNPGGGKVGIGTASPSHLLTLNDSLAILKINRPSNAASKYSMVTFTTGDVNKFMIGMDADTQTGVDWLGFYDVANWGATTPIMSFINGTVAIDTTNPYPATGLVVDHGGSGSWGEMINYFNGSPQGAYGLYVAGSSYAFVANGPVVSYGSVTAPAFYYSSDARLKKNIQPIASSTALAKILALNPVTFNWIDPKASTSTQLGFIAQEVEKVVPELVTTDASTTMKAVDYARVTPLLVGAVQAQQAQIEAQQKEIDELKAEVEALKASR